MADPQRHLSEYAAVMEQYMAFLMRDPFAATRVLEDAYAQAARVHGITPEAVAEVFAEQTGEASPVLETVITHLKAALGSN
ncbi:hypothetical protein [Rubrivirga marina]|uniref:Uncharacterized protein n=1 Tax=Rubrivirga marina TaxID=1196024 RepID=A0A271IV18_9BACT|nr:hypothetical protein [Rubrivirga marina]PAP75086.1 hypothetical protein BSZ37_00775 [Rubrivirga marina]